MTAAIQFDLEDVNLARSVWGHRDEYLRMLESELTVDIGVRGEQVSIAGDPVDAYVARNTIEQLYALVRGGYALQTADVIRAAEILRESPETRLADIFLDTILQGANNRPVTPKTIVQKYYVDALRSNDVVFGVGPAGTGKTYLAMAMAVAALLKRQVKRIVLTRPAVEAGERLGFLPGDLQEKVSPYLRPLYDALNDMLGFERAEQLMQRGVIEVAPLAFMRGRTLNESFVILDEAQNSTREQMKMFLTRLGFDSNAVITGDTTQVDLDRKEDSGLAHAMNLLQGVDGIAIVRFGEPDVVRHPLVKRIVAAYDRAEREAEERRARRRAAEEAHEESGR